MSAKQVEQIIRGHIPGADARITEDPDGTQVLYLIIPDRMELIRHQKSFFRQRQILHDALVAVDRQLGSHKIRQISFHKTLDAARASQIREVVYQVMGRVSGIASEVQVSARTNPSFASITVFNQELGMARPGNLMNEIHDRVIQALSEIPDPLTKSQISLHFASGMPAYEPVRIDEDDEDDCDQSPPNWPSKTGNPSGKGRDNNR